MGATPETPLRIGLIGLGRHGSRYARHLLADVPEARLVAVSRRHMEQGSGLPPSASVTCHPEYRALIADPSVDAVVVVTPPILNREICLAAIDARKPVLVEKPLATTAEDAQMIARAANESGVPMMTAQTLRFDSAIRALLDRRGEIGSLRYLTLTSRMEPSGEQLRGFGGRGCLLEIGIHVLDLIRVLTGDEVRDVSCEMDVVPPAGCEQRIMGRLVTRRGIPCLLDVSRVSSGRIGRAELIGADGQLTADWCGHQLSRVSGRDGYGMWPTPPDATVVATLRAFARALQTGTPPPITVEDGRRAVEIAEACYASARQGGRPVSVDYS